MRVIWDKCRKKYKHTSNIYYAKNILNPKFIVILLLINNLFMSIIVTNGTTLSKNRIVFEYNNNFYHDELRGDNVLNVFNRQLMNVHLNQYEDTIGRVTYDDIIDISVITNENETIDDLPHNLKYLFIMSSTCASIVLTDNVKQSIEKIIIDKSNMSIFPNVSNCNKLSQLKINHSNLSEFSIDYDLPRSLREFNLYGNNIKNKNVNFSYDKLTQLLHNNYVKLNFSDNYLDYDLFPDLLARKCNLVRQKMYEHCRITRRNVGNDDINDFVNWLGRDVNVNPTSLANTIFGSQSVHLSSVNRSVKKSVEIIRDYVKTNRIDVVNVEHNKINTALYSYFSARYNLNEVNLLPTFELETKHSVTELTYRYTFELVFAVMSHLSATQKFNKDDLLERLYTELVASKMVCFTGKYNRLINSLVGILDGVYVGISEREEIQLEFAQLINRLQEKAINKQTFANAVEEACNILVNEENKGTWIDALCDYAPEPEIFENNSNYLITWDDFILDSSSRDVIGVFDDNRIMLF